MHFEIRPVQRALAFVRKCTGATPFTCDLIREARVAGYSFGIARGPATATAGGSGNGSITPRGMWLRNSLIVLSIRVDDCE
jgi:hypothetical protein